MDATIQKEIERQQSQLMDKLVNVMDTKMHQLKREFEIVAGSAHEVQLSEIKRIKFTEPRSFKKKGHEHQYKHNEQIKEVVTEAKDAIQAKKIEASIAKLDEGIHLIEQRQKLILLADKSEYGWKTVGEYVDNELAENDEDAKRMKKAEKEAERKLAAERASKSSKSRFTWSRKAQNTAPSRVYPNQQYSQLRNFLPQAADSAAGPNRGLYFPAANYNKRSGTCFACGKTGHWRFECPVVGSSLPVEKKLSMTDILFESELERVTVGEEFCVENQGSELGSDVEESQGTGDFVENEHVQVRGNLKRHLTEWKALEATEPVLDIITEGYKMPFLTLPESEFLRNNRSALDNEIFVTQAISELLDCHSVEMVECQPKVVNPLSVSVRDDGKKRLVLDLRHVNPHLFKYKFRCEDIETPKHLFQKGFFLYTFDIKSAYHHVEIFPDHRCFLGFQWHYNGKSRFFVFNVLPFGLSTAPYIFTKLLKPVVSSWRSLGKAVCMFLDDGIGGNQSLESARTDATFIRDHLVRLGFVLSDIKCKWEPSLTQTWLGHVFDMSLNRLYVTDSRVHMLKESLAGALARLSSIPVKQLARVVGQIISMSKAIGPTVYLRTRHMYYAIESRESWRSTIVCPSTVKVELLFWVSNVSQLNGTQLYIEPQKFDSVAYSDASEYGFGGYVISAGTKLVCHGMWGECERNKSSTWREAKAISNMLRSLHGSLRCHNVQWNTDNQNVVRIIQRGSRKPELQEIVEQIVSLAASNSIVLQPVWVPREENQLADYISKLKDIEDWGISVPVYQWVSSMWGPFTVDRFATWYNTKCRKFNSRFWNPGCDGVDAFAQNWRGENNWVVPPPSQIVRAWRHFYTCRARGALVVPLWKGSVFWPCLCPDGTHLSRFITDWVGIPDYGPPATVQGRCVNTLFKGECLGFRLIAVYIDYSTTSARRDNRGFCMISDGLCDKCTSAG